MLPGMFLSCSAYVNTYLYNVCIESWTGRLTSCKVGLQAVLIILTFGFLLSKEVKQCTFH